ncbi:hypothetical protein [Spongiactinospora sp. TRM90649]|uniref:hypothetical protein n=1 Tax=Spongiactinospora sp. TRM90649 TaxID=3031114 RepID=UPI0023F97E1C|nr:hypothetical protein [Spongiactinospora sp. TRM90649]MDF5751510.1 hypothetical protein [Spongiactinospora sp. TRM90649]
MRNLLVGAALAGSLATGLATPAVASASASASASVAPSRHHFGPYYSNSSESFSHESYFKGYWYKQSGKYYFAGDLFDRHRSDRDYSYVWFRWHDKFGRFHQKSYKTFGRLHFNPFQFKRDFDLRVCEGRTPTSGCGGWHDVF